MTGDLTHLVGAAAFAGFLSVTLLVIIASRRASPAHRQRLLNVFLVYVLGVTFTAGLTHRDLWPFSGWPMMTVPPPEEVGPALPFSWIYGVADDGTEYPLDPRALEPLSMAELLTWIDYRMPERPEEQQRRVGRLLLDKANEGRAAVREGRRPGSLGRILGPFGAPRHLLFAWRWAGPDSVPETPFVAVRWYTERWNIDQRQLEPDAVTRILGFEYRP